MIKSDHDLIGIFVMLYVVIFGVLFSIAYVGYQVGFTAGKTDTYVKYFFSCEEIMKGK